MRDPLRWIEPLYNRIARRRHIATKPIAHELDELLGAFFDSAADDACGLRLTLEQHTTVAKYFEWRSRIRRHEAQLDRFRQHNAAVLGFRKR